MSNPFARPHTTSEWLLGSICWTGSCLGACFLINVLISKVLGKDSDNVSAWVFLVSFGVAQGLIWVRAVAGGNAIIRHDERYLPFSWTRLVANLWLAVLTLVQLACLLGLLLAALVMLADGSIVGRFGD